MASMLTTLPTADPRRVRLTVGLAGILLLAIGTLVSMWMACQNSVGWGIDFNQFYSASQLVGTGHLYDYEALQKIELQHGLAVPTGRLPVVILGMKMIGMLPYAAAQTAWLVICSLALILAAALWPGTDRRIFLTALAWSTPATLLLVFGQDTPLWLLFFTIALLLLTRQKSCWAGILFSLCICKFHLALGIPVLLLAQKNWKALGSGAAGVGVLIGASFLLEGRLWPQQYLSLVTQPLFSPAHERMPNLRGLSCWLPHPGASEIVGGLALLVLLWFVSRGDFGIGVAGAATAAGGLVLGRHAYANDCALIIPLAVVMLQLEFVPTVLTTLMKMWAALVLTPVPALLLTTTDPYVGVFLYVGFVFAALVLLCWTQWQGCLIPNQSPIRGRARWP